MFYKVPPVVPPRPDRPGAPEVTVGQGAASSASQVPQFGSPQTAPNRRPPQYKAPPVLPTQGKASFKGPPHNLWLKLGQGRTSFDLHTGPPGISITGLGWRITLGIMPVGRSNKRRSHRQSRLVHHASTRGQLQAPWQIANQSSFVSIGTAFWIVGGIRHRGCSPRRPELLS